MLAYQDGFDGWGFLGAADPAGNLSGPTVVGFLDGTSASFAITPAGISSLDGLGVSSAGHVAVEAGQAARFSAVPFDHWTAACKHAGRQRKIQTWVRSIAGLQ